jgi:hypothetical protein
MAASGFNPSSMGSMGGNSEFGSFFQGLPGVLQGLFGNSGEPYKKAWNAYQPYYEKAEGQQNPFYNAGTNAIPQYQNWVNSMQNPQDFINHLMNNYQQSPWARFQTQQGVNAANNAASKSGLIGSTPLANANNQMAQNISSQDMNNWLQNVLGINTQYGKGLGQETGWGQHAADILSQLASNAGEYAGGTAYGEQYGKQQDRNSLFAGIAKMFGG